MAARKDAEPAKKRSSVFGLSAARSKSKSDLAPVAADAVVKSEGFAPSAAAVASVATPEGSPIVTRTRRSMSVANLKDKLVGKSEYRRSIGESATLKQAIADKDMEAAGVGSNAANTSPGVASDKTRLRRQISEKFSRSSIAAKSAAAAEGEPARSRAGSNTPALAKPLAAATAAAAAAAVAEEPAAPRFLARPAASIPEREALLTALSSCVVNLTRMLGSTNKAARMLGQEPRSRSSSNAQVPVGAPASQQPAASDSGAVLECAGQLGEAIAVLSSRMYEPGGATLARETLSRVKALEDVLSPLFERSEDGREWREVYRRFGNSVLRLLAALEAHLRDPESAALSLRVRTVLDELHGAGYYLKAFLSGVLVDAGCEQVFLACSQSLFQLGNAAVTKLVSGGGAGGGSAPPLLQVRQLAEALAELRLSAVVLSPVMCCRDASTQLLAQCAECEAAIARVEEELPGAAKLASLARSKQLAGELQCVVRTAVSAVRVRIQANTVNVVALLPMAETVTAMLQSSNVNLAELRPLLSQLSGACDSVRGGLLTGSKIQSSVWAEVHAHQKRVLADAMFCERATRPLLGAAEEQAAVARDDALDAMLVSAIRLSCNVKSFVAQYVCSNVSDADNLAAACSLVATSAARQRARGLLAASWNAVAAVEGQLRSVGDSETQKQLFKVVKRVGAACRSVAIALDVLEGLREPRSSADPSWQQLDPTAQLTQLPAIWDGPSGALIEAAKELLAILSGGTLPGEVVVALLPVCDQLSSSLASE